jgi:hypothetical protein
LEVTVDNGKQREVPVDNVRRGDVHTDMVSADRCTHKAGSAEIKRYDGVPVDKGKSGEVPVKTGILIMCPSIR